MNYTLDSIHHAVETLKENYKTHEITFKPLFTSLNNLKESKNNIYYFGLISFRNSINSETNQPFDTPLTISELNFPIIDIEPNSQIIELFRNISSESLPPPLISFNGHFRGFEITIQNL